MFENKSFQLAVLVSIFLHFSVFLITPYTGALPRKERIDPIKVAYFKVKAEPKKVVGERPRPISPLAPEALPKVKKDEILNPPQAQAKKKEEPTVETITSDSRAIIGAKGKKFETVVNDEKDSGKKAAYIGYYRSVRERIRYYADRNYIKQGSAAQGEVFLSFVVTSSGELLHIMVIDAKSADDAMLRNIAVDSVRDASPFPAFPQGMNQYQVTFNVIISFELNK
ncbi:MAG: TonB family protein [Candidatus Omnitrophota bacterium]|nr:TonB family protein [Candidatus Omnitrophota bacterium]